MNVYNDVKYHSVSKSIVIALHLYVLFSWVKRITNRDSRTIGGMFMEIY